MYELLRPGHEEICSKLTKEIHDVLGGEAPTYTIAKDRLPYLRAVLYETLRLHPVVPNVVLQTQQNDVLPGGINVAGGTTVRLFVYGLLRDAKLYPEPEVFRPERWIPFKQPSPWEFPVFKGGPRLCLGMNMALVEASVVI